MEDTKRPLEGIRVVELATMVAAPATGRFLADMGAEVVKIESAKGDMLRWGGGNEGHPDDELENMTFDLENANKKGIVVDLRNPQGKEILFKLLDGADVFLTNWRPQALARQKLSYEDLKTKYPSMVYATLTGYGDKGPDCNLPGFDSTAFFARGGWSGTLYQKGTVPPNWTVGLGDHQASLALSSGILAALLRAKSTGQGEKVSVNLLHVSIFVQSLLLQCSQYGSEFGGQAYPIDRASNPNPLFASAKTKDGRFIQILAPVYDPAYDHIMETIGRPDLKGDPVLGHISEMQKAGRTREMYDIFQEAMVRKTADEWREILTKADIAFSICQTWDEVLSDPQAWANDVFYEMDYPRGKKALVRTPVDLAETPLPEFKKGPLLGEHTDEVLEQLGYASDEIAQMKANGVVLTHE